MGTVTGAGEVFAILILKCRKKVSYAINIVIRNQAFPGRAVTLLVTFYFFQSSDSSESQEGGEAAVIAHKDVCVQSISHHDGTSRFDLELTRHTVENVSAGLAYDECLTFCCHLHCFHKTASP